MTYLDQASWIILWAIIIKDIAIGSEFNFLAWIRYGREYRLWYSSRESFGEYMKRIGKKKVGW